MNQINLKSIVDVDVSEPLDINLEPYTETKVFSPQIFENMTVDNLLDWLSSDEQTLGIDYPTLADNSSLIPQSIVKCTPISDHLLTDEQSSSSFQMNSTHWHFALAIAYGTLLIGGLSANLNTIRIILRRHKSREHRTSSSSLSRSIFTINLLVADLLLCVFSLPFAPAVRATHDWPFGRLLCITTAGTQPAVVTVSVWSLAFVVINKYRYLCNMPSKAIPTRMAVFLVCLIWCCGILIAFPYMAVSKFVSGSDFQSLMLPGGYCGEYCIERWPSSIAFFTDTDFHFVDEIPTVDANNNKYWLNYRSLCSCVFLLVNLVIPLSIIIVCYVCIYTRVRQGNMLQAANEQQSAKAIGNRPWRVRTQRRQRRLGLCSMAVVLGFVVCWLPILTRNFLKDLNIIPHVLLPHEAFISLVTHFLAMCSVVLNPVLLWWFGNASSAKRQPQKSSSLISMSLLENNRLMCATQRFVHCRHNQKETNGINGNRVTLVLNDKQSELEEARLLKKPFSAGTCRDAE